MEKKINHGLSILKVILAFYVVKTHSFKHHSTENKIILYIIGRYRNLHVPSFMIMSFYFNYNGLISKNASRIWKRFERLLIPYIFWPIIIYLIKIIFCKCYNLEMPFTFKKLIVQFILGNSIINPLWFHFSLMITTLSFLIIIHIITKNYLFVFHVLMIMSYFLQYSKTNFDSINNIRIHFKISINREIEMIPYAVTGFNFASVNIINHLKSYRYKSITFSVIIFLFLDYFSVFIELNAYSGIRRIISSICLFLTFSQLPFEKIKNKYINKFIEYLTRYTAGIYYLHTTVKYYLRYYFKYVRKGTLEGSFIIYIVTYLICNFGIIIFGKTKAKYLFS